MHPCTANISRLSRTTHQNIQRPLTASGLFSMPQHERSSAPDGREITRSRSSPAGQTDHWHGQERRMQDRTRRRSSAPDGRTNTALSRDTPGRIESSTCRIRGTGDRGAPRWGHAFGSTRLFVHPCGLRFESHGEPILSTEHPRRR